ncbi:MAG: carbamate kinase [Gammaproteobacteria bacterium]
MRIVIALGGNALLRRGESLTSENQRQNIGIAAKAVAPLVAHHELVITHGNGPQVGLLALQGEAYDPSTSYPLDILDAETEGMIGYLIEQELMNCMPLDKRCITLLTQIEVDAKDSAFQHPSKPIGPVYSWIEAQKFAHERGWSIARDNENYRRVVASPRPQRILELDVIEWLVAHGIVVICVGGGGIPVVKRPDGSLIGVEAVIDKDLASALLARELKADFFMMLTDIDSVYRDWETSQPRPIHRISSEAIGKLAFASGSMAPKVAAACEFVEQTGGVAGIGQLKDATAILAGAAGTIIISS